MAKLIRVDRRLVLNILTNGLGFESEEIPNIGEVVKMSPRDAFTYAVLSSSGYLDPTEPEKLFQLTRDHYRVFNQAEQFELQQGVFSLSDLRFFATVNSEAARKTYIGEGEKHILPIEYDRHTHLQQILQQTLTRIEKEGLQPSDFIITPIRKTNSSPTELESFFEYVVSTHFNRRDYITDTQIPFYYGVGTPDVAAYRVPEILDALSNLGFIKEGGSPVEIMAAATFGFHDSLRENSINNEAIVFEVKTGQLAAPQIKKYTQTGVFNKAYEVIPCVKLPEKYAGLITAKSDGRLQVYESKEPIFHSPKKQESYLKWLKIYLKCYVIANLRTEELEQLVEESGFRMNRNGLLDFVRAVDFENLALRVKFIVKGRRRS